MTEETVEGVALAVELVNTRSRPARPEDTLEAFVALHGGTPAELRALRADLIRAFEGEPAAVNAWLAPPVLAASANGFVLSIPDTLPARAAHGLAALVAEHGLDRLGTCSADDCQRVYADTSPRGSRRFCSRTCSTRTNVRRHRGL